MSDSRKFKFVSPGIFLNEIDQSQIPSLPDNVGPVIVGRTEKGPGMVPVRVNSFSEFVEKFGNPVAGRGGTLDVWRDGNYSSPTYAAYAAQAYLNAGVGPVTTMCLIFDFFTSCMNLLIVVWLVSRLNPNSFLILIFLFFTDSCTTFLAPSPHASVV